LVARAGVNGIEENTYKGEVLMTSMRKGESEPQPRFRGSRFFHSMEEWYFITRERTVEGPFGHRVEAEKMLETYLNGLDGNVH
jgi:hypothetical protein